MVKERDIRIFSRRRENELSLPASSIALIVFLFAFAERLILTLLFWNKFGPHASQCIEIWFFCGIGQGTIEASLTDPTVLLLSILGYVVPQNYIYQATSLLGAALSSLIAVLLFILGKEILCKKLGIVAALLYAAMLSPLYYGITCFVHDSVQLPLFLGTLIAFFLSLKNTGKKRILWGIASLFLFFLGTLVNIVIYVVLDIVAVIILWEMVRWFCRRQGISETKVYIAFIGIIVLFAVMVRLEVLPLLLDKVLSYLPQGRTGTVDIVPMSAERVWMKYNVLLFFLPFGIWRSLKRKDNLSFTLFLVSLLVATLIERGSRLFDFGVALVVAHGFIGWRRKESLLFPLSFLIIVVYLVLAASPFFDFRYFSYETVLMAVASSRILSGIIVYIILCLLFLLLLSFVEEKKAISIVLLIFTLLGMWVTYAKFFPDQFASFGTTEAEYDAYLFLSEKDRGPIYVFWDHAYFAQSVSGLLSVSNAEYIDSKAEEMMLSGEKEAAAYFSQEGVKYVVITTRDANIYLSKISWQKDFRETLFFQLMQEPQSLSHFHQIFLEVDKKTGIVVKVFEVSKLLLYSLQ